MGQGSKKKGGIEERPTYFDLEPFKLALKKFLRVDGKTRVRWALTAVEHENPVRAAYGEDSKQYIRRQRRGLRTNLQKSGGLETTGESA